MRHSLRYTLFGRHMGLSPFRYLTALRVEAARRLLLSTDLAISSVASQCGYPRAPHFNAAFIRRYGMSPGAFRARRGA